MVPLFRTPRLVRSHRQTKLGRQTGPKVRLGIERLEDRIVPSAQLVMNSAAANGGPAGLSFQYTVLNAASVPFGEGIYRSAAATFSKTGSVQVGALGISAQRALAVGSHTISLPVSSGHLAKNWLQPDPVHPYLLAVADPNNVTGETDSTHDTASFHVYSLAALAPGFTFPGGFTSTPPDWVNTMAASLQPKTGPGYDYVIPFGWQSDIPDPSFVVTAGMTLAGDITTSVSTHFKDLQPNDVIDVNLIGHSRGAVVVSEVMGLLANTGIPQLDNGYKDMFVLDPHPANLSYGLNGSFAPTTSGITVLGAYVTFEILTGDPAVVVPANVDLAESWYEKTPYSAFPASSFESTANLQGLAANKLVVQNSNFTSVNLTGMHLGNGQLIGHGEMPEWFQENEVAGLLMPTYSAFQMPGANRFSGSSGRDFAMPANAVARDPFIPVETESKSSTGSPVAGTGGMEQQPGSSRPGEASNQSDRYFLENAPDAAGGPSDDPFGIVWSDGDFPAVRSRN